MKKIFTSLAVVLFAIPLFSQHASISYRLEKAMEETPNELHHIGIQLSDRVDIYSMAQEFDRNRTSIRERSEKVVAALKAKAAATQGEVINFLKNQPGVDIESINGYWINNMVFAKVPTDVIQKLETQAAIEAIDLNGTLKMVEYFDEEVCEEMPPPVPGRAETGLIAIKAHEMWKMGYTGRGRFALGADTGIDPSHPAIRNQYRGIYIDENRTWYDAGNNRTTSPFDCGDHGTHTIGTVLGIDRLTDDTIGVAINSTWIGAKIICADDTGTEDNISSFEWAINPDGDSSTVADIPDAINNSWRDPQVGDDDCNSIYVDVLQALEAVGIAVIFSAGNAGPNPETLTPPHNINYDLVNLFSVGALDGNTNRMDIASFSSRGPSHCMPDTSIMDSARFAALLIKPEVSAPGVAVRSCVPGGEYGNKSGTSMSAPHVTGAILLLREAFPYLTGRDLKFALYYSARDMGDPGEDNDYGRGLIDVKAAFDYLVDAGNVPVDPTMENDALLIHVDGPPSYCANFIYPEVLVENLGSTTMTSLEIHMEFPQLGTTEVYNWTGNMEPGERMTIIPDEISLASGTYEMNVELKNPNGMPDEHVLNNRFSTEVIVTDRATIEAYAADDPDGNVCEGTQALLRNEFELTTPGRIIYEWYDKPAGGSLIGTGQVYLTDTLKENTTFYADILVQYDEVGATDNSIGTVNASPFVRGGIEFDASFPFLLKSVTVFPSQNGFINIVLKNQDGDVIEEREFFVNRVGEATILNLDYDIPQGNKMKLELQQGQDPNLPYVPLLYNRTGGEFPYVIDDVLSLNKSTAGSSGQYWYFYDWKVEHREVCGRTPVRVMVNSADAAPAAAFSKSDPTVDIQNDPTVIFTDESTDAMAWNWNFGDGTTSTEENPTHTYAAVGEYIVSLTVTNDQGCTASAIDTVRVIDASSSTKDLIEIKGVKVFPNPTSDLLNIEIDFDKNESVGVQLTDMLGTPVRNIPERNLTKGQLQMNLSSLSSGVYLLVLKTEDGRAVRKILKL